MATRPRARACIIIKHLVSCYIYYVYPIVSGEWNFYVFESSDDSVPSLDDEDELQRYLRFGLDESLRRRPTPPPRVLEEPKDEEKNPTFRILPYVRRTTVELKFPRKTLEEFMDR